MKTQKNAVFFVLFVILAGFCLFTACEQPTNPEPKVVEKPTATPTGGSYTSAQTVTLATATAGAAIHYTLDGTDPTAMYMLYSSAITISETKTLKAIAVKSGWNNSEILTETYTITIPPPGKVVKPTATPAGGNYTTVQTITLVSVTEGATIRYTLDGTEPTTGSTKYSNPIAISTTTTLKAIATKTGMNDSDILTETYTITTAGQPSASPPGGNYVSAQTVTLTTTIAGADIHYTLDGTTPTASSTLYSSPLTINETTTIKAIAIKAGISDSGILTATYTINRNGNVTGPSFPSGFARAWIRDNFNNTLTFTSTTLKASNQSSTWNLTAVSGDSYTLATGTTKGSITIKLVNGNLEITGDSGTGENNWNGTWKPYVKPSNTINDPENLTPNLDLGTMTEANSGWRQLLNAINTTGKYVNLDLSACTMNGTSFNPDSSVATGKDKIVSLVLPTAARGIEAETLSNSTFKHFINLTSVSGANILTIGNAAFYSVSSTDGNKKLQSMDFPQATTIGNYAFAYCTGLQSVSLPQATNIGYNTFYWCTNLGSVNLPQATSIGDYAFGYCTSLQNISLPQATSIGYSAFSGCTSLQSVSFPASVTLSTVNPTFSGCTALTSFTLSGTGALSVIENGKALVRNGTVLVEYPSASGAITMNTITSIFNSAFYRCTNLTSVSFPLATSIGDSAFYNCTNLQSVNFPQTASIGSYAFEYCTSLQNASFPQATTIGGMAFYRSGLQSLNIPKVTDIGMFAFGYSGTAALSITMGSVAPTLSAEIFTGVTSAKTVTISIPTGATGYTPFTGTAVTVSGTDTTANWANGLRGGGWTGTTWASYGGGTEKINQNITLIIEQQ